MNQTESKIMVCPFCGSDHVYVNQLEPQRRFWVECNKCETTDPKMHDSHKDAIDSWNNAFCWEAAKKSQCIYCGHVGEKKLNAMFDHALVCEKRPDKRIIAESIRLADENLKLRKRVAELEGLVRDRVEEDGGMANNEQ